jgi:hypothetical protein
MTQHKIVNIWDIFSLNYKPKISLKLDFIPLNKIGKVYLVLQITVIIFSLINSGIQL